MGMNLTSGGSDEPDVMIEMNMTPLIDVMLVLIIMLIITIPIQNHAINLNMPNGNPPPQLTLPVVINVDIGADGTILWNGVLVENRHALEQHMRETAAIYTQPELHIRPNKLVPYKVVAEVMATAQRLGVVKLGMVGNEQFL